MSATTTTKLLRGWGINDVDYVVEKRKRVKLPTGGN